MSRLTSALRRGAMPLLLALATAWPPRAVPAQGLDEYQSPTRQRAAWSALRPIAEPTADTPEAPSLPGLLSNWAPRVGLFWTLGLPAALPDELDSARTDVGVADLHRTGTYRDPLVAPTDIVNSYRLDAWRRPSARSGVVVSAELERRTLWGSLTDADAPMSSSPFVTTDTSTAPLRRSRLALDGAEGWRLGSWGAGVTLGYESMSEQSDFARQLRSDRSSAAGVGGALTRALLGPRLTVALFGRYLYRTEQLSVAGVPFADIAYPMLGLSEPQPLVLAKQAYNRLTTRDAVAGGGAIEGDAVGAHVVAYLTRERLREGQSTALEESPPTDYWTTGGWRGGAAVERSVAPLGVTIRATGEWRSGDGSATLANVRGTVLRSSEREFTGQVAARWAPAASPWMADGGVATRRFDRLMHDDLAELDTQLLSWTPAGWLELSRAVTTRLALSAGYAAAQYVPAARIPAGETLGPQFQRLLAPALEMQGTPALSQRVGLGARWRLGTTARVWLTVDRLRTTPGDVGIVAPFRPRGDRTGWDVSAGYTVNR